MCVCVCVCVCVCACCAPRVRAISLVPSTAVNCNQNDPTLDNRPSKKFTQSKHPNQCTSSEHPNTYIVEHTSLKKKHIDDKLSLSCTHISEDTSGLDTRDIKQVHLSSNHIHTSLNTHHLHNCAVARYFLWLAVRNPNARIPLSGKDIKRRGLQPREANTCGIQRCLCRDDVCSEMCGCDLS